MKTPKDFEFLRERIYARVHIFVSRTTLMRLWGYINENVETRTGTLSILAQFLGYQDWDNYCQCTQHQQTLQSSPLMSRTLDVQECLKRGDKVRLIWQPGRICDVEYLGNLNFVVTYSEKTRLHAGDTFACSFMIEGEPLFLANLKQGNNPSISYVCGKNSGIRFEYME